MNKLPTCPPGYNSGTSSIKLNVPISIKHKGTIQFDFARHIPYSVSSVPVTSYRANKIKEGNFK